MNSPYTHSILSQVNEILVLKQCLFVNIYSWWGEVSFLMCSLSSVRNHSFLPLYSPTEINRQWWHAGCHWPENLRGRSHLQVWNTAFSVFACNWFEFPATFFDSVNSKFDFRFALKWSFYWPFRQIPWIKRLWPLYFIELF